jgi:hypothetical protein
MKKPICDWSDDDIKNLIANYARQGKKEGGLYTLAECHLEITRRLGGEYSGREVAEKIVKLSKTSQDGLVTYKELFNSFYPDKHWQGHGSLRVVAKMLGAATYYCATTDPLPMVTSVVVQQVNRAATDNAKKNLFNAATDLGIPTGADYRKFFAEQAEATRSLDPTLMTKDQGRSTNV